MSIFDKRVNYKPFEYPEILTFTEAIQKAYWVHGEVDFTSDIQDYHANLDDAKREIHKRSILSIAQVEVTVKGFWGDLYHYFPKPELNGLGATFAECEFRHSEAYSRILEVNGYLDEFNVALQNPIFKSYNTFVGEIMRDENKSIV
ncbi:ribonucleotide-diphosphate reductase subunit beta, partial [Empedobacter sp.]